MSEDRVSELTPRQQTALARFGEFALLSEDLDEILERACRHVSEAAGTEFAEVLELEPDGATLRIRAGVGWDEGIVGRITMPADPGSSEGHALRTGEPVAIEDIDREQRYRVPDFLRAQGVRALVSVAIIGARACGPYGVLRVDSRSARRFGPAEVSFLRAYANLLASAVARIRALAASRDDAAFLAGILDASPDCVTVLRANGAVAFMNRRALGLHGFAEAGEVLDRPLDSLWPPEERARVGDAVRRAAAGETVRFEGYCPTATGAPRWWEVRLAPMRPATTAGDGPAGAEASPRLLGVSRDITERIRDEAARREEGKRLSAALRLAQLGRFDWTPATGAVALDARAREILGFADDEGASIEALYRRVHADDLARLRARADRAAGTAAPLESEFRVVGPDRAQRHVLLLGERLAGAPDGAERQVGVVRDVTDRRRIEARLRQLNDRLRQRVAERTGERDRIWNSTSDLMGTAGLDGFLREVNPAWSRTLGWSEAELRTRPFTELLDPADHPAHAAALPLLARGETVTGLIGHVIRKDGARRTVMWDAVPDGDEGFHLVGRDISDLRRVEAQLRQSQKMEAVGQLTGGLAHDFNNLLTGITGSLALLRTRAEQGRADELGRYIDAAQGAANRAAALTHRLLAFSRQQTLTPRATDVNALVDGMAELIRRTAGPAIAVEFRPQAEAWPALVDQNQLENALLNLCINARDAMPQGGRLRIETANRSLDAAGAPALAPDLPAGDYLALSVIDDGVGMTAEVVSRAFDPFFTTKALGQGTGLGLSMIYGFARQSGGQVGIVSEPGRGAAVTLHLPRHRGDAVPAEDAPARPDAAPQAEPGLIVLVVDDEATIRMLVADVLEDLGYRVLEAEDGASGLALLGSDRRIDLVISDIGLPGGMNGRQMVQVARRSRPALPVLFITGYAETAVFGQNPLEPGTGVLTKPFALEVLADRIREMIAAR